MRLFVALPIAADIEDGLWPLQDGVPGADWTEPDAFHLTLAFIGEVDPSRVGDLSLALDRLHWAPFPLQLRGLGYFPPRGQPKVLWAGVANADAVTALHRQVQHASQAAGFSVEHRAFKPHVTLARLRHAPPHRVAEWLGGHVGFGSPVWQVDAFALYQSVLRPEGAEYRVLRRFVAR